MASINLWASIAHKNNLRVWAKENLVAGKLLVLG
jgi:hypothetical protein